MHPEPYVDETILRWPIRYLCLPAKIRALLQNAGIPTIIDLMNATVEEIRSIDGIGPKALDLIVEKLASMLIKGYISGLNLEAKCGHGLPQSTTIRLKKDDDILDDTMNSWAYCEASECIKELRVIRKHLSLLPEAEFPKSIPSDDKDLWGDEPLDDDLDAVEDFEIDDCEDDPFL